MKNVSQVKESFIVYRDWWNAIRELDPTLRCRVVEALMAYAFDETVPSDVIVGAITAVMRSAIDRDKLKWEAVREKRRDAGRLGGAPKGNSNASKQPRETNHTPAQNNQNNQINQNNQNNQINQNNQKQAKQAKQAVNVNVNDNVNDNVNEEYSCKAKYSLTSATANEAKVDNTDKRDFKIEWEALSDFFNATMEKHGALIPRARKIDDRRRRMTMARLRDHGKEAVKAVIEKAAASRFLNGGGNNGFRADYTWIMRPDNFLKILEGYYDNKTASNNHDTHKQDRFDQRRGVDTAARNATDYTGTL